jgi:hypothetical protein
LFQIGTIGENELHTGIKLTAMAPRILINTTVRWPSVARYAGAFALSSCHVEVHSPSHAPVCASCYVRKHHPYRPFFPLASLRAAIMASEPDLIVSCDDRAVAHVLRLYEQACATEGKGSPIAALVERSLGSPENYPSLISRSGFIATARDLGVRAPETFTIAAEEDLEHCLTRISLPAVLKVDGSWGGDGVAVVRSREEARAAYRRFSHPPSRIRSVARAGRRRDAHYLLQVLAPSRLVVSAQRFIPGHQAASAFACWKGEVVGAIYYDVLVAQGTIGPPNVIKRVNCAEMDAATRQIAHHFSLSGIYGMDFIRDAAGAVHLLEINPRTTQGGILPFGQGSDLPAALAACVAPDDTTVRPAISNDVVAFFPREWQRDPGSLYLTSAHHDVPWDDPAVLRATLGLPVQAFGSGRRSPGPTREDLLRPAVLLSPARHTS